LSWASSPLYESQSGGFHFFQVSHNIRSVTGVGIAVVGQADPIGDAIHAGTQFARNFMGFIGYGNRFQNLVADQVGYIVPSVPIASIDTNAAIEQTILKDIHVSCFLSMPTLSDGRYFFRCMFISCSLFSMMSSA